MHLQLQQHCSQAANLAARMTLRHWQGLACEQQAGGAVGCGFSREGCGGATCGCTGNVRRGGAGGGGGHSGLPFSPCDEGRRAEVGALSVLVVYAVVLTRLGINWHVLTFQNVPAHQCMSWPKKMFMVSLVFGLWWNHVPHVLAVRQPSFNIFSTLGWLM